MLLFKLIYIYIFYLFILNSKCFNFMLVYDKDFFFFREKNKHNNNNNNNNNNK